MNTLFTFQKFPKSICSQDTPLSDNEQLIEANIVEYEDGSIHFLPYIDPKEIYLNQHNNCVGEIWKQHYIEFSNFVSKYEKQNIVEIAGGNGNIFLNFKENNPNYKSWKIIDINPTSNYEGDDRVNVVKGFYEPSFVNSNEVVISSHFVEHVFDLEIFLPICFLNFGSCNVSECFLFLSFIISGFCLYVSLCFFPFSLDKDELFSCHSFIFLL